MLSVTLTACLLDRRWRCRRVNICHGCWVVPTCDHLTYCAGGRDAGGEGQRLRSCMHCKCHVSATVFINVKCLSVVHAGESTDHHEEGKYSVSKPEVVN